jgi:regulatory protein
LDDKKIFQKARNNAYSLLRMRPRSEREVRDRLKIKGYDASVIENVVSGLKKTGDINDEKFARFWMESRMHSSPVGDVVLKHELKQKGIAENLIEATLEAKAEAYDDYAVALNMAREKFIRLAKLDRNKAMKRLYDFLVRRGYGFNIIEKVVEEVADKGQGS